MIRVVLDTNVVVSAYLNNEGQPYRVLKLVLSGLVKLCVSCVSEAILDEYTELIKRKRFPLKARGAKLFLQRIRDASVIVKPVQGLPLKLLDRDDAMFLECSGQPKRTTW